jgi:hypothetical protein
VFFVHDEDHPVAIDGSPDGSPAVAPAPARAAKLRAAGIGVAIGFSVAVAATSIAFSIIAMPLYMLARTEPGHGVDRDLIRKGLFGVAVPVGVLVGMASGVLVAVWYARGGRLPRDRTPINE